MKEIPQTLDELIDKKLVETESTTRKHYGSSREEKLAEIARQQRLQEEEARKKKRDTYNKKLREWQERFNHERKGLISKIEKYPDVLSILETSLKCFPHSDSSIINYTFEINDPSNDRFVIKVTVLNDYNGKEDIAADLEFCDLFLVSGWHKESKRFCQYSADCGTGMNGGYLRLDGFYGSSRFSSDNINYLGKKMKGGLIEIVWREGSIHIDPDFGHVGESMEGGKISVIHEKDEWVSGNTIGKNMKGGRIYFGDIVFCEDSIGENMSGGEIIIEGGYKGYNFDQKKDEYFENTNMHIGKSMSGGRIVIKDQVYEYWEGKNFTPIPLERIGENMTGGTIILEKYCYRGGTSLYRRPKFDMKTISVTSGGWFMPNIYSKRLVIER